MMGHLNDVPTAIEHLCPGLPPSLPRLVEKMLAKLRGKQARGQLSDGALAARARELSNEFLQGRARPTSVRWVTNQRSRWGSCTPSTGEIRISERVASMPAWVRDYVLVHELAHLLVSGHDERFWAWVHRYPRAERAMGYLQGYAAAAHLEDEAGGDAEDSEADSGQLDDSNSNSAHTNSADLLD